MALSTVQSIVLVMFVLGPISVFSETFPSSVAATDKQLLKPANSISSSPRSRFIQIRFYPKS